jgi:hypothetical protein
VVQPSKAFKGPHPSVSPAIQNDAGAPFRHVGIIAQQFVEDLARGLDREAA